MLNKDGGVQADVTVSVLDGEISNDALSPCSHGKFGESPCMVVCWLWWAYDGDFYSIDFFPGRSFYVAVGGGIAQYAWCHIKKIIEDNRFDCMLIDKSEDMGMLSIQGPKR